MPFVTTEGTELFYRFDDFGKAQTIVLSNSLGTDHTMWDAQVAALSPYVNILRYDTRGHGQSGFTEGEYPISLLGEDVIRLLDALGLDKVHFCGLSIGGLTGQWLGIHVPERFHSLTLCNTAAKIGNAEGWNSRIASVAQNGLASIISGTRERWFTPGFVATNKADVDKVLSVFVDTSLPGYLGCCAAVRDADFREKVAAISLPTLIIAGTEDSVTTVADGEYFTQRIKDAQLTTLHAAHISSVEQAEKFNKRLIQFITNQE